MIFSLSRLHPRQLSERGQMAIFIALIFQVLFVFFAMIVNVGLIVHDKINLQNSVDLAAYYGAQRQAELLNAIAHENYQIRQAWKLLSWRIRVLGDMGYRGHPLQIDEPGNNYPDTDAFNGQHLPVICINHSLWGNNQNVCYEQADQIQIPELKSFTFVNPFFAGNFAARIATEAFKDIAGRDGEKTGPQNFNIALRWARAYRVQVAQSKEAIRAYADLLSGDTSDFLDVHGKKTREGSFKTLAYNLTRANRKYIDETTGSSFSFFNSLGAYSDRKEWLHEVPIYPLIYYADLYKSGGGAWKGKSKPINGFGTDNRPEFSRQSDNEEDVFRNEPNDVNNVTHSIYGVEKNPWVMAYVGVYAETKPRKPYLPFGEPIVLRAKAFAKPFGGRIGPWYYKQWPEGSKESKGNTNQRVDQLAPIPLNIDGAQTATTQELNYSFPNYSRYPGDKLGLNSRAALALFKSKIKQSYSSGKRIQPAAYSGTPAEKDGLAMALATEFGALNEQLPNLGYKAPWIREVEVAAIAPDLFDVTYYSIDRNAFKNYLNPSLKGNILKEIPYDIGSIDLDRSEAGVRTIADQISIAKQLMSTSVNFWMIKQPEHLLTGWAPSGAFKYDFPQGVFGECTTESSDNAPVPGKCAVGGRVGYSVKIVSEDYLKSENLPLGGEGTKGRIKNPPPDNF